MELKAIIKTAETAGWTVTRTKGNHVRFLPTDKTQSPIISSGTPSDWRSLKNLTSQLRRAGLAL